MTKRKQTGKIVDKIYLEAIKTKENYQQEKGSPINNGNNYTI